MLSPQLLTLEIDSKARKTIQDKVFEALLISVRKLRPRVPVKNGIPSLTVTDAKERLAMALPEYRDVVGNALPVQWTDLGFTATKMGDVLHKWINEASLFFRGEGGDAVRTGLHASSEEEFFQQVWNGLFSRKILGLVQSSEMLRDENGVQLCDLVIESLKKWTRHVCSQVWGLSPDAFNPSAFFLDTETALEAELEYKDARIHLRGKPDAVFFDQQKSRIHVWEFKFGRQGQVELQIAQVLLYMSLIEAAKGCHCSSGCLTFFRLLEDTTVDPRVALFFEKRGPKEPFDPRVEKAFQGYVGNDHAVYQLKVLLTLGLKQKTPRSGVNFMFCGPGGTGKTELARRMAEALGTPFVNIPATAFGNLEELVKKIDSVVEQSGAAPEQVGTDSGMPLLRYPALTVFIDEVHAMAKKADSYLNMLEPKERRAVCRDCVCDFSDIVFLAATTGKGRLPAPFLSRFRIIDLRPYTLEEMCEIVMLEFRRAGRTVSSDVCEALSKVGRFVPRVALERTRQFLECHEFSPLRYPLSERGIRDVMAKFWELDPNGLTPNDLAYLEAVQEAPRGVQALVTILPCGKDEVERVIEPYLIQLSAIRLTGKGREITEIGRSMLSRRDGKSQ
jgi:Holliday junction resolvasome RuvABC ATP-dependent DNA helicase subunit